MILIINYSEAAEVPAAGSIAMISENIKLLKRYDGRNLTHFIGNFFKIQAVENIV